MDGSSLCSLTNPSFGTTEYPVHINSNTHILFADDFLIVGDGSYLYTRPMTSSTLTKINTYIGSLQHVTYDPVDDKIYWAASSSIGRYDYGDSNKETLVQSTTYNGQTCNSKFDLIE